MVKNIEKNKDKLFEMKDYSNEWVIQPNSQHINLIDTIKLILKFNEEFNYENENENDDETISQNEKKKKKEIIKRLNDDFDKIIDKSKSFEEQIKSIRKVKNLKEYYDMHDYDNKELKLKIFKLQIARLSNIINEKLFEQIFGHTLIKLANKVINTKNKEEYKIIVKNVNKNIDNFMKWMIMNGLICMTLLILFQTLMKQFNQIWFKNIKIKNEQVILIRKNSQKL